MAVRDGPLVVLGVPLGGFGLFGILGWRLFCFFFVFFAFAFFRGFFFGLLDDDLLDHVGGDDELFIFFLVLEADNSDNLANVALDCKEFVHESKLQTLLVRFKLVRVAEALKENESLTCAALSDFLLDELHHQGLIVVNG